MTRKKMDLVGHRYGRLVVLREHPSDNKHRKWECACDCGGVKITNHSALRAGTTQSCGCLHREMSVRINRTHGMSKSSEYKSWQCMTNRCTNPDYAEYKYYGGRGIKVCDSWLESFENFYEDMGDKTSKDHSLDRIDNNGDYEPSNCRWATGEEQNRNRRNNIMVEIEGETKCLTEWCHIYGINVNTVRTRIYHNKMDPVEAIKKPVRK